jgi:hypothetical protein
VSLLPGALSLSLPTVTHFSACLRGSPGCSECAASGFVALPDPPLSNACRRLATKAAVRGAAQHNPPAPWCQECIMSAAPATAFAGLPAAPPPPPEAPVVRLDH